MPAPIMNLDDAIKILNANRHRDWPEWYTLDGVWVMSDGYYDTLQAFEAIAIAEKYVRMASTVTLVTT